MNRSPRAGQTGARTTRSAATGEIDAAISRLEDKIEHLEHIRAIQIARDIRTLIDGHTALVATNRIAAQHKADTKKASRPSGQAVYTINDVIKISRLS